MHTQKCENAKTDRCKCSCKGRLHKTRKKKSLKGAHVVILNDNPISIAGYMADHPDIAKQMETAKLIELPLEAFDESAI